MLNNVKHRGGLPCFGGKSRLLVKLIPILNWIISQHGVHTFADVCGGGGKVSLAINQYKCKIIYNEYERGIAKLMACLSQKHLTKKVEEIMEEILRSEDLEEVFKRAVQTKDEPELDICVAGAYSLLVIYGSFSSNRKNFHMDKVRANFYKTKVYKRLYKYNPVIGDMIITCTDCFNLIRRYKDEDDVFLFIDPPYVETSAYKNDWENSKHEELVDLLLNNVQSKVVLCGIDNDIYKRLEQNGWYKYFIANIPYSSGGDKRADEYIWTNVCLDEKQFDISLVK